MTPKFRSGLQNHPPNANLDGPALNRHLPSDDGRRDQADTGVTYRSFPYAFGPHVSAAGGVENAVLNAARIGANAFALFVKSQRKWAAPPLTESNISTFKARMTEFGYSPAHVLVHGSYLMNLGNPDDEKREKSYECFLDEIQRCEQLGLEFYNFHPGSTVGRTTKEHSIALIAEWLTIVIENMAGAGNVIGSKFSELRGIIDCVENKDRVGVCLDTCHLYAAGYDISTQAGWEYVLSEYDNVVGLSYLRGLHLNDARTTLGSKKDRHENIGLGPLSLTFRAVLTDPRMRDLPLILETPTYGTDMGPDGVWAAEISVLYRMAEVQAGTTAASTVDRVNGIVDREGDGGMVKTLMEERPKQMGGSQAKGKGERTRATKGRGKKVRDIEPSEDAEEEAS
ncbi:xylose isomerase-like protein [Pisolithus orientalis]|uniref:xylose isomerase-like protein n=1 Tax=Pisolithus orientalis TaxID=936130 RepID=UPI0022243086|nr:xylose isomerase-like protein [Pisolithus orientalis]KAI5997640.1 xylose isomerase-like protein [Pisolithus orientalis]